jgi:hypothetical protein
LNPEKGLLVGVFQFPGSKVVAPGPEGEVGLEQPPVPARQLIPGSLTIGLSGQQNENFVARVDQIQKPALHFRPPHELVTLCTASRRGSRHVGKAASGQLVGQVETSITKPFFRKVATGPPNSGQLAGEE